MYKNIIIRLGVLVSSLPPVSVPLVAQTPVKEQRPNILFILSDDHTSQSWGIYGGILSEYVQNQHIRTLAAEGCVLENCFCTNSISSPSRATILTGAYSHCNGVFSLEDGLNPEADNLAKQCKKEDIKQH